jgi:acyl carrier protein
MKIPHGTGQYYLILLSFYKAGMKMYYPLATGSPGGEVSIKVDVSMAVMDDVKAVIGEALQISDRVQSFDESTALLGSIPELDSMAVVTIITALEEQFDFIVDDDEISAETFETLGSLSAFVEQKM